MRVGCRPAFKRVAQTSFCDVCRIRGLRDASSETYSVYFCTMG
jgi:hypothetical protein